MTRAGYHRCQMAFPADQGFSQYRRAFRVHLPLYFFTAFAFWRLVRGELASQSRVRDRCSLASLRSIYMTNDILSWRCNVSYVPVIFDSGHSPIV